MVAAAMALEPSVEPVFHEDSYGYRPGRSPGDAVIPICQRIDRGLRLGAPEDPAARGRGLGR
jgi:hypothetical protein